MAEETLRMSDVAQMLAGEHAASDEGMDKILWFHHDREIRLVEVSHSVGNTGEILPFRFSADPPEVPFESIVILLGSEDAKRLDEGQLELPQGWNSNGVEVVFSRTHGH